MSAGRQQRPKAGSILVVDDNSLVRKTASRLLTEAGHRVDTSSSGEDAFERCLRGGYDLVVSDVTMGALSGVQLCRLLRSDPSTARVPVILLTAADDPKSRFWGRNAGADVYLAKEAMHGELLPQVAKLLAEGSHAVPQHTGPSLVSTSPLERLSVVLEQHLFQAVVGAEVRRLMHHVDDRALFARAVLALAAEVAEYAYLLLRLEGPQGITYTLHARGPWPSAPDSAALAALRMPDEAHLALDSIRESEDHKDDADVVAGEHAVHPVIAGSERLGELVVFGGAKRLAKDDEHTIELLGEEIGMVAKSVFLVEQTRHLAHTDSLTGLYNRRRCSETLRYEVARAARQGTALTVALCDIDHFKRVNDEHGHGIGDAVLKATAKLIQDSVRLVDTVARWGGEEFIIVLPSTGPGGGRIVAERLRHRIEQSAAAGAEGPTRVTISVGLAVYEPGMTTEALVDSADQALYRAKARGRNRVELGEAAGAPVDSSARKRA